MHKYTNKYTCMWLLRLDLFAYQIQECVQHDAQKNSIKLFQRNSFVVLGYLAKHRNLQKCLQYLLPPWKYANSNHFDFTKFCQFSFIYYIETFKSVLIIMWVRTNKFTINFFQMFESNCLKQFLTGHCFLYKLG